LAHSKLHQEIAAYVYIFLENILKIKKLSFESTIKRIILGLEINLYLSAQKWEKEFLSQNLKNHNKTLKKILLIIMFGSADKITVK